MKPRWLLNVVAYTVAGSVTSGLVGAGLGLVGDALLPGAVTEPALIAAIAVGALATARTLGVVRIPFPQPRRQTLGVWAKASNPILAAVRWGLHIGLIYTTRFTFPGIWFVTAVAVASQRPAFGSALLVAYWIGRVLPVWLGPLLMRDGRDTSQLLLAIEQQFSRFEKTHVVALALGVVTLSVSVGAGSTL